MPLHFTTVHGTDRLKLWLDCVEYPGSLYALRAHCTAAKPSLGQMPYNAVWKSSLELFQPSKECLRLVLIALGNSVRVSLEYAEIAIDLVPDPYHGFDVDRLEQLFISSAFPKHHRQAAICVQGTWYFERRADINSDRRSNVLTVYSDKPSKLDNNAIGGAARCVHIEWRVSGSEAMRKLGLRSLDDLINFDHHAFWSSHIELYHLPRSTQLGRLLSKLSGGKKDSSDQAFRKRAKKWKSKNSIRSASDANVFVLYNAMKGLDRRAFRDYKVTFKQWRNGLK
jgi:hypothetical protein